MNTINFVESGECKPEVANMYLKTMCDTLASFIKDAEINGKRIAGNLALVDLYDLSEKTWFVKDQKWTKQYKNSIVNLSNTAGLKCRAMLALDK